MRERALATVSFEAQEAPHNRPETVPSRRSLQFQNAILIPRGEAGVSSKTGLGLEEIKGALIRLMNSKEVFPDVGTVMPLSYGLLMHLAAGEAELPEAGASYKENRTKWERDIAERVARKEGAHLLQELCARPVLDMAELRNAAVAHCGFERREVDSAVRFLHRSGAVLLHEHKAGTGGHEVEGRVFMRPQWIVDAVKYVIRDAHDVNEELRALDRRVRDETVFEGALNDLLRFGQLDERLLRECLWRFPEYDRGGGRGERKFPPGCHDDLIGVMQRFGLLRRLREGSEGRFLVPAMLQEKELPSACNIAATWAPQDARGALACLRWRLRVQALPGGFFGKWQLAWSARDMEGLVTEHFLQEHVATFASRSGTVLTRPEAQAGEADVEETVVVAMTRRPGSYTEIRVAAWVDFIYPSDRAPGSGCVGSTSWGLFRKVTASLEEAARASGAVDVRVPLVDPRSGAELDALALADGRLQRACIEPAPGVELLCRDLLPPKDEGKRVPLHNRSRRESTGSAVPEGPEARPRGDEARPQILVFCAQRRHDDIDVFREAQKMQPLVEDSHWLSIQPQTTFEVFRCKLASAAEQNTRVVHFMGHGDEHGGLFWVKQGNNKESERFDTALIADVLKEQRDTLRCLVLNACGTLMLARELRALELGDLVCWKGAVRDDVARKFSQGFYETLKRKPNGYREAFKQGSFAVRELQQSQLQEGKQKPPGTVRLHPWPWSHSVASLAPRPRSPCGSPRARPDGAASSAGVLSQRRGRRDSRG